MDAFSHILATLHFLAAPAPVTPSKAGLVVHTCLQQSMRAPAQGRPAAPHLGHQRVMALSSTYDSSRLRSYFASSPASPASSRRTCRASGVRVFYSNPTLDSLAPPGPSTAFRS